MKIPRVARALLFASIGLVCDSAWAQVVTEFSTGITAGAAVVAITQGPDGNLWFTEEGLDRIGRITPLGAVTEFSAGITAGAQPRGIARGPDGNLWFAENGGNRIGKIDPTTGVVAEFSAGITAGAKPRSIAAGPDGNLWFTEEGLDQIGKITPAGAVTEFGAIAGITPGAFPFGITAGPDGNLWFTENAGNRIGKIDPTTGVAAEFSFGIAPSAGLLFITAGPDGNLWFTEVVANQIGRITPAGAVQEFGGLTAGATPNGITAGSDGNLWFTEALGNAIGRMTPTGVLTGEFSTGMTAGAEPRRITSGLDGNLWFTEFGVDKIGRIPTGGNTSVGSNVVVDLNGGASAPGGVTISFAQGVTGAGDTAGTTSSSCPAVPSGFSLGTPAVCYDLTTTAVFTPPVQVCINFSGVLFVPPGQPALLHDEGGTWVDVTTSVDTTNHVVCGNVNSLSPFVVAAKVKVSGPVRPNASIPTLSQWGLITLAMLIVLLAARHVRMRRP
jgi:streptogramin lyase